MGASESRCLVRNGSIPVDSKSPRSSPMRVRSRTGRTVRIPALKGNVYLYVSGRKTKRVVPRKFFTFVSLIIGDEGLFFECEVY